MSNSLLCSLLSSYCYLLIAKFIVPMYRNEKASYLVMLSGGREPFNEYLWFRMEEII